MTGTSTPEIPAELQAVWQALEVLADDAAEAGYFVRAEAAADLAFRVRCALAKEED